MHCWSRRRGQQANRVRGNARAGGVEREFADRNTHAADPEIAEAENPLAVGHDDEPHVLLRPVQQQFPDPAFGRNRQIKAAGVMEDVVEFLARLADGWRVDNRHEGRGVGHQHRVIEGLVARLQIRQRQIFLQVAVERGELRMDPGDLTLQRRGHRRQQAFKSKIASLDIGEGRSLVGAGIAQQGIAPDGIQSHQPLLFVVRCPIATRDRPCLLDGANLMVRDRVRPIVGWYYFHRRMVLFDDADASGSAGPPDLSYFATNPACVISCLLSASSSSRNCSMSLPVRKIGFSACFSM